MPMKILSIILFLCACIISAHATETLIGNPNEHTQEVSEAPAYPISDKVDEAILSGMHDTIETLRNPNQSRYLGVSDPHLREKMAQADLRIAATYDDIFKDCENFLAHQGGMASFLKFVIYAALILLSLKTAKLFYDGDTKDALKTVLGMASVALAVLFASELLNVMRNLV